MTVWNYKWKPQWIVTTNAGRNIDITDDVLRWNVKFGTQFQSKQGNWVLYSAQGDITVDNTGNKFDENSSVSVFTSEEWGQGAMVVSFQRVRGGVTNTLWRGLALVQSAPQLATSRTVNWVLRGRYYNELTTSVDVFSGSAPYVSSGVETRFTNVVGNAFNHAGTPGVAFDGGASYSTDLEMFPVDVVGSTIGNLMNSFGRATSSIPYESWVGLMGLQRPKHVLTRSSGGNIVYAAAPSGQRALEGSVVRTIAPVDRWGVRMLSHGVPASTPAYVKHGGTISTSLGAANLQDGVYTRDVYVRYVWPANVYHVDWDAANVVPSSVRVQVLETGFAVPRGDNVRLRFFSSSAVSRINVDLRKREYVEDGPLDELEVLPGASSGGVKMLETPPWLDITGSPDAAEEAKWMVGVLNRKIPTAVLRFPFWGESNPFNGTQVAPGYANSFRVSDTQWFDGMVGAVEYDGEQGTIPTVTVTVYDLAGRGLRDGTATKVLSSAGAGSTSTTTTDPAVVLPTTTAPPDDPDEPPDDTTPTNPVTPVTPVPPPTPPPAPPPTPVVPDPVPPRPVTPTRKVPATNRSETTGGDAGDMTFNPRLFLARFQNWTFSIGFGLSLKGLRMPLIYPDGMPWGVLYLLRYNSSGTQITNRSRGSDAVFDHNRMGLAVPYVPRQLGYHSGVRWVERKNVITGAFIRLSWAATNTQIMLASWRRNNAFYPFMGAVTSWKASASGAFIASGLWSNTNPWGVPAAVDFTTVPPRSSSSASTPTSSVWKYSGGGGTDWLNQLGTTSNEVWAQIEFRYAANSLLKPTGTSTSLVALPSTGSSGDAFRARYRPPSFTTASVRPPDLGFEGTTRTESRLNTVSSPTNPWNGKRQAIRTNRFVVLHTTEGGTDGSSGSAARQASYLRSLNGRYAGYHYIIDENTTIEFMNPATYRAYHSLHGGNDGIGIGFACRTTDWASMPASRRTNMLTRAANALKAAGFTSGPRAIPKIRVTTWDNTNIVGGYYAHATIDPGRKSDPGTNFPWTQFLALL